MPAYHAKKRLGQNFLKSQPVIDDVIRLVHPCPDDSIVEIGPGRGALTLPLAASGASVWAVEFDRDLIAYLQSLLADYPQVRILNQDFLVFDPASEQLTRFKLVGNLPYNLTSPVIDWCVEHHQQIESAVLMVQKEVGRRLAASPGSKNWSPLSIFSQMVFRIEPCFEVSATHFKPQPQVESSVLRLTPLPGGGDKITPEFQRVVRASFRQRRKTLSNNLVPELISDAATAQEIFQDTGLEPKARAESISIDQFLKLTAALAERKLV